MELHPRAGGRVVLDRELGDGVRYRAAVYTPDQLYRGAVEVAADGTVSFAPWEAGEPPDWLVEFARAFLRSEWRARQKGPDPAPWPARISRWRDKS